MSDFNSALIADLRANHGKATSGPFVGSQILILTTTGAKSGTRRESPLAYSRDGEDIVIVASKGGAPSHPAWYHNIVADPHVTVEVDGETIQTTARIASSEERRRLYDLHATLFPSFAEYEQRTAREIPVIIVRREASVAA